MKKAILFIISSLLAVSAIITTSAHSYSHFPNGDVNLDNKLSVIDATQIQKSLAETITLSEEQRLLADFNLDGKINIVDATKILSVLAGIENPPTEIPSSTSPENEYVTPGEFGVPEDANDDLRLFQKALDAAAKKNVPLDLEGKTYHIYTSEAKCPIINGTLKIMPSSSLVLTGNKVSLKNVNVSRWWKGDGYGYGDVRLHLTDGCVIENCNFSAHTSCPRIFCNTAANNTIIKNCTFSEGFGILFNDGEPETRKYNNKLYTNSIGKGLIVDNCIFNTSEKPVQYEGDNVEVNTPNFRFSDVQVTNCVSYGAKINTNVGIGFGFAQVDHIVCSDNKLYNIQGSGAIHMEACTDVESNNNTVKNSQYGIMCIYNKNASYSGNTIEDCDYGIYCSSEYPYGYNEDICFSDNNILNCAPHPLTGSGMKNSQIINNTFQSNFDHINAIIKLAYDKSYETNNVTVANNIINYTGSFSEKNWAYIIGTDCNVYNNTITGLKPSNFLCSDYLAVRVQLNLPPDTPLTDTLYFASELNNWNPADTSYSLTRTSETTAEIIIDIPKDITHNIEFKITRGSWDKEEINENGQENVGEQGNINHILNIYGDYGSGYCSFDIKNWKDFNKIKTIR